MSFTHRNSPIIGTSGNLAHSPISSKEKTPKPFQVIPILVLMLAQMGTTGDNGAVSLATATLTEVLHATLPDIHLVNTMYSVVAGALMIAGGLAGTVLGWKRTFRIGAVLCATGEFIMALATNISVFIWLGRMVTGLGASFMIPAVLGIVPRIYQGRHRLIAFGAVGAANGISTLFPIALGRIMDAAGFRFTFGILGCYFLIVFGLSFWLPQIKRDPATYFDFLGTLLAAIGLFFLIIGLIRIPVWGLFKAQDAAPLNLYGLSPSIPLALTGALILAVLIRIEKNIEKKHGIALLPQSFIKTPQVIAGLVCSSLIFLFMMSMSSVLLIPWLQLVGGRAATFSGTMMVILGIPMVIFSIGTPKFIKTVTPRTILQIGYLATILGIVPLYFCVGTTAINMQLLVSGLLIAGTGLGLLAAYASSIVALALNERDAAQSGGVQATARNVGQAFGIAILGTTLLLSITSHINNEVHNNPHIREHVAIAISSHTITLVSDEHFESLTSDIDMTPAEERVLQEINAEARVVGVHRTFEVLGLLLTCGFLTTFLIGRAPAISQQKDDLETGPSLRANNIDT